MEIVILASISLVLFLALVAATWVAIYQKGQIKKYEQVKNLKQHITSLSSDESKCQTAVQSCKQDLANQKQQFAKYAEVVGAMKNVAEAKAKLEELDVAYRKRETELKESHEQQLRQVKDEYKKYAAVVGTVKSAAEAQAKLDSLNATYTQRQIALDEEFQRYQGLVNGAREISELTAQKSSLENVIAHLNYQINDANAELGMIEIGQYKRIYDFEDPEYFKAEMDRSRDLQKDLVKLGLACRCNTNWVIAGSEAKGRKMANDQIKLTLRAFNGECDAAIAKVKTGNYASMEKRIRSTFDTLNKLNSTNDIVLSEEYLNLRIQELRLTYELEIAKKDQKEREREIREQMAEEAKAEREIEKAQKEAEREEDIKARALEEARQQMAAEHGQHNAKLEELVSRLENELKEAIDRKAKAIARAQLTKSGHVYVLSNIGTMGENRFKIGMTRRLEPLVRVAELGDASVPFPFDVHAMIYSEDAPALECALHQHFASRRVNRVNLRKEYFDVTLKEIIDAVREYHGLVTFVLEPEALQYRETLAILSEQTPASVVA